MLLRIQSNRSYFRATCTYAMSKHSASMRVNKNKYRAVLLDVYFNYVLHIILSLVFPFHNDKNVLRKLNITIERKLSFAYARLLLNFFFNMQSSE